MENSGIQIDQDQYYEPFLEELDDEEQNLNQEQINSNEVRPNLMNNHQAQPILNQQQQIDDDDNPEQEHWLGSHLIIKEVICDIQKYPCDALITFSDSDIFPEIGENPDLISEFLFEIEEEEKEICHKFSYICSVPKYNLSIQIAAHITELIQKCIISANEKDLKNLSIDLSSLNELSFSKNSFLEQKRILEEIITMLQNNIILYSKEFDSQQFCVKEIRFLFEQRDKIELAVFINCFMKTIHHYILEERNRFKNQKLSQPALTSHFIEKKNLKIEALMQHIQKSEQLMIKRMIKSQPKSIQSIIQDKIGLNKDIPQNLLNSVDQEENDIRENQFQNQVEDDGLNKVKENPNIQNVFQYMGNSLQNEIGFLIQNQDKFSIQDAFSFLLNSSALKNILKVDDDDDEDCKNIVQAQISNAQRQIDDLAKIEGDQAKLVQFRAQLANDFSPDFLKNLPYIIGRMGVSEDQNYNIEEQKEIDRSSSNLSSAVQQQLDQFMSITYEEKKFKYQEICKHCQFPFKTNDKVYILPSDDKFHDVCIEKRLNDQLQNLKLQN
ncbi:UNKNOWN [Stylonychia lemnae]|uniref:Uncharacterized protein n=1 Tax=Stylonychia lemnae TaxID=5949 RepID=A0A077ZT62_STYLE|nr:UNKNOWN [Stylonychia lemnae]|eukprot:CDW73073.1 UNKNOWN [Stylonychia lemnae]